MRHRAAMIDDSWAGPRPPVSVVILTLNESVNIEQCLRSCSWCDDVHVLDSGSTDGTADLARGLGAGVWHHPFESFGKQRNWAIENIPLRHPWVFHLDADERFTPELVEEMDRVIRAGPPEAGFHVPNKLMVMGRWLKRAGGYPTYQMRLFHTGRMRFRDYGHGQREDTQGAVGKLKSPYLHFIFSKGLYEWIDKHNRYSSLEALQALSAAESGVRVSRLFGGDPIARRRAWKELSYQVPLRPQLRWLLTMFVQGGVLEGRAGWTYASLLAMYERMIALKLRLLRHRHKGQPESFEKDEAPRGAPVRVFEAGDKHLDESGRGRAGSASAGAGSGAPAPAGSAAGAPEPAERRDEPIAPDLLVPEASPWTFREKALRALWMVLGRPIFRLSPREWYEFRATVLRLFGARIGRGTRLLPSVQIEVPWNLDLRDGVVVGERAILYSLGLITIGGGTVISQHAHLCAGTHDYTDRRFPLIRDPITVGPEVWIGADAYIGPNVRVGRRSVVGARASVYKDLPPDGVYVGNPAKPLKRRVSA